MAGLRGNVAWVIGAKQAVKGTAPALTNGIKLPLSGGNIGPVRETDRLTETDASRDAGVAYVTTSGVEGEPQFYVRDRPIAAPLFWGLGTIGSTGAANFTHTITPGNTLPYVTFWRDISDTLYEQFLDCQVSSLNISAEAGQPLVCTMGVQGRQSTRLTVAPDNAAPIAVESGTVYNFNDATVTLAGGVTALVRSFELNIENNVSRQQTDDVVPYDVYAGQREVSLTFDLLFETLTEYNQFHYGGAAGTVVSPNIYTTSALFSFDKGANNSVAFNLPSIAYEEFPVEPDAGGDPITVSVRAVGMRSGSPIVTATVKNQQAGTLYA